MLYHVLKNNILFLLPYFLIILLLIPPLLLFSKSDIHLWINQFNSSCADWFFRSITFAGDGLFIIFVGITLLFFSLRHFIFVMTTYLSTGLLVQLLKRLLFEDIVRPAKYFQGTFSLHLVDGIEQLSGRSFPSGHATSAFALFLCLALIIPNRGLKLFCFIAACLVAFSRVYLSQHFLVDIFAGSLIGCAGALAWYMFFYRSNQPWHAWNLKKIYKNEGEA